MNIQEFIDYRQTCPVCDHPLITKWLYFSSIKQISKIEDDRIVFISDLESFASGRGKGFGNYSVGYSFDLYDNSYYVNFYHRKGEQQEELYKQVPLFLIRKFIDFNSNHKQAPSERNRFIRECSNCFCYWYSGTRCNLSLKTNKMNDLEILSEKISLIHPLSLQSGYKIFNMLNNYENQITSLYCRKSDTHKGAEIISERELVDTLPIISISDKEQLLNKLKTLILFS